eukprot:scaffold55535_cov62-Phaeocystis_antarctica.AAC.4
MSRESEGGNFRGTSFNLTPPKFAPCELQPAVVNIFPAIFPSRRTGASNTLFPCWRVSLLSLPD